LNELKLKKKEKELLEKDQQRKIFKETTKFLQNHEEDSKNKQREIMIQMAEYNKQMEREKLKKMEDELRKEYERDAQTKKRIENEKKDFFKYAENCINNWKSGGKNVMPLLLEMKKYKDFMIDEERR
jgi:hypothetical protein